MHPLRLKSFNYLIILYVNILNSYTSRSSKWIRFKKIHLPSEIYDAIHKLNFKDHKNCFTVHVGKDL